MQDARRKRNRYAAVLSQMGKGCPGTPLPAGDRPLLPAILSARELLVRIEMDRFAVAAFSLFCGSLLSTFRWEVTVVWMAGVAIFWTRIPIRWTAVAAVCFWIGGFRAVTTVDRFNAARAAVEYEGNGLSVCEGDAVVVSSPIRRGAAYQWDAEVETSMCEGAPHAWRGRSRFYSDHDVARGDRLRVLARIGPVHRFWNESDPRADEAHRAILRSGTVIYQETLSRASGIHAFIDRARSHARDRIELTFDERTAPLARALVLGENDLSPEDDVAFRSSGLSHLLAVSGMHLVLAVLVVVRAIRALLVRFVWLAERVLVDRIAASIGIGLAWVYADFAGGSGSAVRAAWMMSAILLARAFGKRSTGARAYALSVVAISITDPLAAYDVSVVLSVLATGGLLLFSRTIERRLTPYLHPEALRQSISATLSATIACTPFLLRLAPRIPVSSLVANLLAAPLGEMVALPLCLLHGIAEPLPFLEKGAAYGASLALSGVAMIARTFAAESAGAIPLARPLSWELVLLAIVGIWGLANRARWWVPVPFAVGAIFALEIAARRPPNRLRITFFDVAQGDSSLVELPNGFRFLIDGGGFVGSPTDPGVRVIVPFLEQRRISSLSAVVLSHPHPDHFTGLASVSSRIPTGVLWDTGQGEREGVGGMYAQLLSNVRQQGARVLRPEVLCGTQTIEKVRITVLAPCPAASSDRNPNDNSLVIRFDYGNRSFLFMGDAEREEEGELLHLPADQLHADVIKLGHHGSRTSSSPPFLNRVEPRIAVISSGVRNRFGHPHPTTIHELEARNIRILRTDRDGAITIESDGETITTRRAVDREFSF